MVLGDTHFKFDWRRWHLFSCGHNSKLFCDRDFYVEWSSQVVAVVVFSQCSESTTQQLVQFNSCFYIFYVFIVKTKLNDVVAELRKTGNLDGCLTIGFSDTTRVGNLIVDRHILYIHTFTVHTPV